MYAVIAEPARDFFNWSPKTETPFSHASPVVFPLTVSTGKRGRKSKQYLARNHAFELKERFISLKCKSRLRVEAPVVLGPKRKLLKLSAFKSNGQNDESGGRASGSKSLKNSVGLSYVPQESETLVESPKAQTVPASYPSEAESTTGSLAIQNLFKGWLMLLRMPSANQAVDETLEKPSSTETSETENLPQQRERIGIVKAVWCYLMGLDATVKIPLLIFVPWYLAVNFMYGAEVSMDLTPLWVFGPFIVALYIKLLRGIWALYVLSFKQTVKVFKNLPVYYLVAYNYIAHGKLKEDAQRRFLQPLVDIKDMNYKEVSKRKLKDLEGFLLEKYLDFVESIWPYYCRTIRFLKRANLI